MDQLRASLTSIDQSVWYNLLVAYTIWTSFHRLLSLLRVKSLIKTLPKSGQRGSWIAGNLMEMFDAGNLTWHQQATQKYGGAVQFDALLGDEQIYITDPRALHHILVKDQHIFEEPAHLISTNLAILGEGLLSTLGEQHRKQRRILNPVFHIKHMRRLVPTFCDVTKKVTSVLDHKIRSSQTVSDRKLQPVRINMYEWLSRTALELVGQGGMGYSFNSLQDGEVCEYTRVVKDLIPAVTRLHIPLLFLPLLRKYVPSTLAQLFLQWAPLDSVRTVTKIQKFLDETSRGVLEQRKAEMDGRNLDDNEDVGKDVLSVLLRANERADVRDRLSDDELIGSLTTLIFAAQDTTASALSRTLHTLAINKNAQDRLREEVQRVRGYKRTGGDEREYDDEQEFDYDQLESLKYLDAVCRETLRLYAPVSWLWRVARQPTTLPLLRPIQTHGAETIDSIPIAQNQGIIVGIAAANRDEQTWGADANVWRPERWLPRSGDGIDEIGGYEDGDRDGDGDGDVRESAGMKEAKLPGVYSAMMTFSGGGRACIGFKFSLLEMKVVLAMLIERFEFDLPQNDEIVWRMTNIATPALKGKENETPQLPLLVSLVQV